MKKLALLALLAATGCAGLRVTPPDPPVGATPKQPLSRLRAAVDAEGCPKGPVLKRLADSLLEARLFRSLTKGEEPPDLTLELYCSTQVKHSPKSRNELKAFVSGLFLFLPSPFLVYRFDFESLIGVVVLVDGKPVSSYREKGAAHVDAKFMSLADSYEGGVRAATAQAAEGLIRRLEADLPRFEAAARRPR